MKIIKKLTSLWIAGMLLLGVACTPSGENSSGAGGQTGTQTGNQAENTVTPTNFGTVEGETHSYQMSETNKYIVNDGRTDYKILIPEGMENNEFISLAASDLRGFFMEATGLDLEIVNDSANLDGGKYLAIHDTELASAESIGATYDVLGMGGFRIKTVDDSVVMCGATAEASMYAVYAFLEVTLGFELYHTDFYALDKNVENLKLMNYDVTDVPDFEYRIQSSGWIRYNDKNRKRMRWTEERYWIIPADQAGAQWHNTFVYLDPDEYKATDPEFYSYPKGNQLCYMGRGIKEKRDKMIDIVSQKVIALYSMEKYKDYRHISISIEDNQNCCSCPACKTEKEKYGADSAVIVKFCNDVAQKVSAWMETDEGKPYARDFRILFFAYHATNEAPVQYNEAKDEYEPIDGLVCDPHVAVYFAETNGDYTANFHDEGTANTQIGKNMKGWGALSKEIYFWSYSTNFSYFLTPYNSFDTVQDILKFAKNENAMYIMIQDQWIQQGNPTGFGVFKNWLHSKLEWDVNADVKALTDEFFDGYFMDASKTMRQLYEEWKVWANYQSKNLGYSGYRSVYVNALKKDFWPQRMLERWIALTEQAKQDVAGYKTKDPVLYNQLIDHIAYESIAFRYLLGSLYADEYSEAEITDIKKTFANDITRSGMNIVATTPMTYVENLLAKWGV